MLRELPMGVMPEPPQTAVSLPLPNDILDVGLPKRKFVKGSLIKHPDDESDRIYLIEAGRVITFFLGPQGHDVPVLALGPGSFVGDLPVFGHDEPATYAQAAEDTSALVMNQSQFLDTFRTSPEFAEYVAKTLSLRLRHLRQLYIENRLLPMKTRLYAELLRHAVRDDQGRLCIAPPPTHAELANSIASQRETVTKQISQLVKAGVIESSRSMIRVLNEDFFRLEITRSLGSVE